MAESKFELSLSDINALFKIKYEKLSENVYNSANVLLGRVKKSYNFTGRKLQISIPQSFSGGVGSGSLPKANAARYVAAEITAKKLYARVDIDRETIKASMSSEGAFVKATKEVVKKGVESYMRNMSRILFNDGSGKLGDIASIAGQVVTITDASFKEADLEEKDLVDIVVSDDVTGDLSVLDAQLEIDEVDVDNKQVTLVGTISSVPAGKTLDSLVMQGSLNNDPQGLKGALQPADATGSLYTIPHARRWSAEVIDMTQDKADAKRSSVALSTDLLNEMMLKIKKKCGKSPNLIITSFKQYEKLLNLLENKKQFNVNTRAGLKSKSGADISFSGIEFMSIDGAVGVFPERFCDDDRMYFLNDNHIHIYHRPDFGWFDDDGTVFLRKAGHDEYEARYGGYLETYINPCFHGVVKGIDIEPTP
jgi:hypothetical protein